MFCKKCDKTMRQVMSFYNGKAYEFHRCPSCWYESKKTLLIFEEEDLKQKKTKCNLIPSNRKSRLMYTTKKK